MLKKKGYYTIGELSTICGITKRNLRFYDEKGLLTPSKRDAKNNYRYYSQEKALDALIIKELRKKGLSITKIKLLMKEKDLSVFQDILQQKITSLENEKQLLENQLRYTKTTYNTLKQSLLFLEKSNNHPFDISLDYSPETYIFYTKYHSNNPVTELFWERFAELSKMCETEGVQIIGPFSAVFHDHYLNQFFVETGELEVFFPILPYTKDHPNIKVRPKQLVISKTVIGSYPSLLSKYTDLVSFIETNGLQITGPSCEEYLCDFSFGINESDAITRISFPVKLTKEITLGHHPLTSNDSPRACHLI